MMWHDVCAFDVVCWTQIVFYMKIINTTFQKDSSHFNGFKKMAKIDFFESLTHVFSWRLIHRFLSLISSWKLGFLWRRLVNFSRLKANHLAFYGIYLPSLAPKGLGTLMSHIYQVFWVWHFLLEHVFLHSQQKKLKISKLIQMSKKVYQKDPIVLSCQQLRWPLILDCHMIDKMKINMIPN